MARIYNKDKRLESQPWFSYVAWIVVISFAIFVYNLAQAVEAKKTELEAAQNYHNDFLYPTDPQPRS